LLSLQRLLSDTKPPLDEAVLMARTAERRMTGRGRDDEAMDEKANSPRRDDNGMRLLMLSLSTGELGSGRLLRGNLNP
jgi:hypothetical protein